jgi:hypothetical protein
VEGALCGESREGLPDAFLSGTAGCVDEDVRAAEALGWCGYWQVAQELEALMEGMSMVLSEPTLRTFDVRELDLLVNGQKDIEVDLIRAYAIYQGNFHVRHLIVLWLWQVCGRGVGPLSLLVPYGP